MPAQRKIRLLVLGSVIVNMACWHVGLILGLQFGLPVDEYAAVACRITGTLAFVLLAIIVVVFAIDLLRGNAMLSLVAMTVALLGATAIYFQNDYLAVIREMAS